MFASLIPLSVADKPNSKPVSKPVSKPATLCPLNKVFAIYWLFAAVGFAEKSKKYLFCPNHATIAGFATTPNRFIDLSRP